MKKWIALLLSLCLLLSSYSAVAASVTVAATSGSVSLDENTAAVASLASLNGTLYVLHQDGRVTVMDPATRAETDLGKVLCTSGYLTAKDVEDNLTDENAGLVPMELLFTDGGKLYGLCVATGALYTLLADTGEFAPQATGVLLDTAALLNAETESKLTLLDRCDMDGVLYYVARDDASGSPDSRVGSLNLTTGEAKTYAVKNLQNIQPYKDGKLLARSFDTAALYAATSADNMPGSEYGTFDPATDTFTSLGQIKTDGLLGGYSVSGLLYDAAKDSIYYVSGSRIEGLTLASGETRVSAYTSEGMFGNLGGGASMSFVEGGYFAMGDYNGIRLFALDTDAVKNGALRIFGEFGSDAHKSFAKNYPDIPTEVGTDYTSDIEALASAMVSENNAYDVLLMIMSYMPVEKLIQKGYCIDLSVYPEIMERVAKLDPRFVAGVTVDGKLYGVPVTSTAFSYGVNVEQWKALGLSETDLPTNLVEFYDFIANYMADYGEDNPDVRLFDMGGDQLKTMLFSLMLDNYITYCQSALGGETQFDTDLCREVLTAFEGIDFEELAANVDTDTASYSDKDFLFSVYMPLTTFSSMYDKVTPLILSLTADTEPVLGANLSVLVINPKSKRTADAVKYVCNYLDNLDDSSAIVLHPDDNEPRLDKNYDKNKQALTDEIAKKQALLDAAEDSAKAGIKDEIANLQAQMEELEKSQYTVTAAQIQQFRDVVSPKLAVCQQSVLYSADKNASNELNKLIMQYLSGAQTQDQFLKEMDKRARMMSLENQ